MPEGVRFGEMDEAKEYKLGGLPAIFSSSSIFTGVPEKVSENFFKMLLKGINGKTKLDSGIFFTECGVMFEHDVYFMFGGNWLQIKAKDLVVDLSEAQDGTLCALTFMPTANNYWWFGHNIYKDYYVVHNMSNRSLGFVPTKDRVKAEIMVGEMPTRKFPSYDWVMMLIKLLTGGAMGVGWWAIIQYLMVPTTWVGWSFLNSASYDPNKMRMVNHKQIANLDTDSI